MNNRAQSIVEYALIAILVIMGVVFMGAYVLRSVNAHFKLWDEGTQDSFSENINQANLDNVPPIATNCQCNATPESCGGPNLLCPPYLREVDYTCNLPGCLGVSGNSYCETPTAANPCCGCPSRGDCGSHTLASGVPVGDTIPCPVEGQNGIPASCPDYPLPSNICVKAPANDPTNCYYGYHIYGNQCGGAGASNICVKDSTCPAPACTGFILFGSCADADPSTTYCVTGTCHAPTPAQAPTLVTDTPNFYVGNSSAACNSTDGPCQVYCNSPYVVNSPNLSQVPGTACVLEFEVAPNSCDNLSDSPLTAACQCESRWDCGYGGKCKGSVVDCDYFPPWKSMGAGSNLGEVCENQGTISSIIATPYGAQVTPSNGIGGPGLYGGCGPVGEPGQTCAIEINPSS